MAKLVALTLAVCAVSLVVSFPANNFGLRYRSSKHEEPRDSWPDVIPYRGRGDFGESRRAKVESAEESAEDSAESLAPASSPVLTALPAGDVSDEASNELVPGGQITETKDQLQSEVNQSAHETVEIAEPVIALAVEQDQPSQPLEDAPQPAVEVETPTQADDKVVVEQVDQVSVQEAVQTADLPVAADESSLPAPEEAILVVLPEVVQNVESSNQEAVQDESASLAEASDSQAVPVETAESEAVAPEAADERSSADNVEQVSLPVVVAQFAEPAVIVPLSDEPSESAPEAAFNEAAATETVVAAFDETQPAAVDDLSQGQTEDVTEQVQAESEGTLDTVNDAPAEEAAADEAQVEQDTEQPELARNAPVTEVNDEEDTTETPAVEDDVVARNALSVLNEESQTETVSDSTEAAAPEALERQEMLNYHKGPVEAESTTLLPQEDDQTQFEGSADSVVARNSAAAEQADDSTASSGDDLNAETATDSLQQDETTDSPASDSDARSALTQEDEVATTDVTEAAAADEETATETI